MGLTTDQPTSDLETLRPAIASGHFTEQPSSALETVSPASGLEQFTEQPHSPLESRAAAEYTSSLETVIPASASRRFTELPSAGFGTLRPALTLERFTEQPSSGLNALRPASALGRFAEQPSSSLNTLSAFERFSEQPSSGLGTVEAAPVQQDALTDQLQTSNPTVQHLLQQPALSSAKQGAFIEGARSNGLDAGSTLQQQQLQMSNMLDSKTLTQRQQLRNLMQGRFSEQPQLSNVQQGSFVERSLTSRLASGRFSEQLQSASLRLRRSRDDDLASSRENSQMAMTQDLLHVGRASDSMQEMQHRLSQSQDALQQLQGSAQQPQDSAQQPLATTSSPSVAKFKWRQSSSFLPQPMKPLSWSKFPAKTYPSQSLQDLLDTQSAKASIASGLSASTTNAGESLQLYSFNASVPEPALHSSFLSSSNDDKALSSAPNSSFLSSGYDDKAVSSGGTRWQQPRRSSFLISTRHSEQSDRQPGFESGLTQSSLQLVDVKQEINSLQMRRSSDHNSQLFSAVSVQPRRFRPSLLAAAATAAAAAATDAAVIAAAATSVQDVAIDAQLSGAETEQHMAEAKQVRLFWCVFIFNLVHPAVVLQVDAC